MANNPPGADNRGELTLKEVYQDVAKRFAKRHHLTFIQYVSRLLSVGDYLGQNVTFVAQDIKEFEAALRKQGFIEDDPKNPFGKCALGATKGRGFREPGVPSLHVALHPDECSVHIDTYGFVAVDANGNAYYNPDAIQHIVDELLMQDKFVGWVTRHAPTMEPVLRRLHPVLPTSRDNYRLAVGLQFNVKEGPGWRIGLQASKSISGETRYMGNVEVFDW